MADKNWGFKVFCECGTKYYSMNKKERITCPSCSLEYVKEDLNLKQSAIITKIEQGPKKKLDVYEDIDNTDIDETDDIISLDDQKDIEENNENIKED